MYVHVCNNVTTQTRMYAWNGAGVGGGCCGPSGQGMLVMVRISQLQADWKANEEDELL